MYEMLEIVSEVILLVGLLYFAWRDYQTQTINVAVAAIMGVLGIVLQFLMELDVGVVWELLLSMMIGVSLVLVGIATKGGVGMGDGILFLVAGCYLNWMENMMLFLWTIILTGGFGLICVITKRLGKKQRIPMAPFMLMAFVFLKI